MDKSNNYVGQPIFTQVLSLIDESLIKAACRAHNANKFSKKLSFKDHLATMLYCIFARCTSIREVQTGLELCQGKLNHLNLKKYHCEAILAMETKNEPARPFGALYESLY